MGSLGLDHLKEAFQTLVKQADQKSLPSFYFWVDLKVAEYKVGRYLWSNNSHASDWSDSASLWKLYCSTSVKKDNRDPPRSGIGSYSSQASFSPEPGTSPHHVGTIIKQEPGSDLVDSQFKQNCSVKFQSAKTDDDRVELSTHLYTQKVLQSMLMERLKSASPSAENRTEEMSLPLSNDREAMTVGQEFPKNDVHNGMDVEYSSELSFDEINSARHGYISADSSPVPDRLPTTSSPKASPNSAGVRVCPVCFKEFQHFSSYRRHMKLHEGVFSHMCAVCGRKFTRKEHFLRHNCGRRPNKASRRSSGSLSLLATALASGSKSPKIEFPPSAKESAHKIGKRLFPDDDTVDHLNLDHRCEGERDTKVGDAGNTSFDFKSAGTDNGFFDKESESGKSVDESSPEITCDVSESNHVAATSRECRRKAAMPRKVVAITANKVDDVISDSQDWSNDSNRSVKDEIEKFTSELKTTLVKNNNIRSQKENSIENVISRISFSPIKVPVMGKEAMNHSQVDSLDGRSIDNYKVDSVDGTEHKVNNHYGLDSPDGAGRIAMNYYKGSSQDGTAETSSIRDNNHTNVAGVEPDSSIDNMNSDSDAVQMERSFVLDTGTYEISYQQDDPISVCPEEPNDNYVKITKQGRYLKLRNEVKLINGQACFVCPNCGKIFHRSSNFSRHMRIHRGVYSYVCPNCHRGFFRKEHFQKHKCSRKAMSSVWERKTKVDWLLEQSQDGISSVDGLSGELLEV